MKPKTTGLKLTNLKPNIKKYEQSFKNSGGIVFFQKLTKKELQHKDKK